MTIAVIGLCMGVLAVVTVKSLHSRGLAPFEWVWPTLMATAAAACLVFARLIGSASWWWISRTATVLGVLARSGLVWQELTRNEYPDGWLGVGSFVTTALAAYALHRLWFVDFRYWSRRAARDAVS